MRNPLKKENGGPEGPPFPQSGKNGQISPANPD